MRPSHSGFALAAGGGVVFALTAPPTDVYPAVLVGLAALALALSTATTYRRAALLGWIWATSAALVGMRFIPSVVERFTGLGWAGGAGALLLLAAGQAVAWSVGAVVTHGLRRRFAVAPSLAFGAGVFVAILPTVVIAWTPAGVITPWPAFVQLGEIVGERGVSFLIAVAAALLVQPLEPFLLGARPERRLWLGPVLGSALIALVGLHGALRIAEVRAAMKDSPALRIGVVQGAVEARLRWDPRAKDQILSKLRKLSADAERQGSELTIWPEAAYPYVLDHTPSSMPRGRRGIVGADVRGPVLFGLLTRARSEQAQHNAATIVAPDGRTQLPQAKIALLWFGETVPFGDYVPALRRAFFRAGGLAPGQSVELLSWRDARIGVLNCYEDTLPSIGRRVAAKGPNLLVNLTNDAWFGLGAEPELHLRLAAMRAIEARRDLVRAVNLGAPAWIDSAGVVRERGPADHEGVMMVTPALNDAPATIYTRLGDLPLWLLLGAVVADAAWRRRRSRPEL